MKSGRKKSDKKKTATTEIKQLRKAAHKGDPQAQYDLGVRYELGDGVRKNMKTALSWYQKAAAGGHAEAQTTLAPFTILVSEQNKIQKRLCTG